MTGNICFLLCIVAGSVSILELSLVHPVPSPCALARTNTIPNPQTIRVLAALWSLVVCTMVCLSYAQSQQHSCKRNGCSGRNGKFTVWALHHALTRLSLSPSLFLPNSTLGPKSSKSKKGSTAHAQVPCCCPSTLGRLHGSAHRCRTHPLASLSLGPWELIVVVASCMHKPQPFRCTICSVL